MAEVFYSNGNYSESAILRNNTGNATSGIMDENSPDLLNSDNPAVDFVKLFQITFRCLRLIVSVTGILFNGLILEAIGKVNPKVLKSKPFIQNALIGDILMDIGYALPIIPNIMEAFGSKNSSVSLSIDAITSQLAYLCLCVQAFASVLLAVDRMYAVTTPMAYHTTGYTMMAKFLIVLLSWLAAIGIVLIGVILPFTTDPYTDLAFHRKLNVGVKVFSVPVRPFVIIGVNTFTFVLYIAVFLQFVIQRRMNRAVAKSTSNRTSVSLTLTYFFIHTSSFLLYLPGPITKALREHGALPTTTANKLTWSVVNKALWLLYLCNTVINPIILGTRVRLVRQNLCQTLKVNTQKHVPEITKSTS